ncbi:MAG TPA: type II toxin-antitoxin system HicB family antitoxin [bacterium]
MRENKFIFPAVIIKELDGYSGLCLDLDVASDGDTPAETRENLIEAVNLYVETAIENNLPIIRPVPRNENPIFIRPDDIQESFKIKVDLEVFAYA